MTTLNYLCSRCECNPHRLDCVEGRRQSQLREVSELTRAAKEQLRRLELLESDPQERSASEALYLQQCLTHARHALAWLETLKLQLNQRADVPVR